jgi:hypothetical protein
MSSPVLDALGDLGEGEGAGGVDGLQAGEGGVHGGVAVDVGEEAGADVGLGELEEEADDLLAGEDAVDAEGAHEGVGAGAQDDLLDGGEREVVGAGGLAVQDALEGGDELLDGLLAVARQLLGDGAHGVAAHLAGVGRGDHAAGHVELAAVDRVDEPAGAVLGAVGLLVGGVEQRALGEHLRGLGDRDGVAADAVLPRPRHDADGAAEPVEHRAAAHAALHVLRQAEEGAGADGLVVDLELADLAGAGDEAGLGAVAAVAAAVLGDAGQQEHAVGEPRYFSTGRGVPVARDR